MSTTRDRLVVATVAILLAAGAWFVASPQAREPSDVSSTYSADPKGAKAFYTLLGERLGYTAGRLRRSYSEIPRRTRVLVVIQPQDRWPITPEEAASLESWVRSGGTVIFASDKFRNVPERFRRSGKMGAGTVYALDSRRMFTNEGVRDYRRAMEALELIARHARPPDTVLFDEYHHGFREGHRSIAAFVGRHVRFSLALLAAAGLVVVYSCSRRFGSVRPLPEASGRRSSMEFVGALAMLYKRAGAADVAAEILCSSFERELRAKLGLQPDASKEIVLKSAEAVLSGQAYSALSRVLGRFSAGVHVGKNELADIAADIYLVEQELGIAPVGN